MKAGTQDTRETFTEKLARIERQLDALEHALLTEHRTTP